MKLEQLCVTTSILSNEESNQFSAFDVFKKLQECPSTKLYTFVKEYSEEYSDLDSDDGFDTTESEDRLDGDSTDDLDEDWYGYLDEYLSELALIELLRRAASSESEAILCLGLLRILAKNGLIDDVVCRTALFKLNFGFAYAASAAGTMSGSGESGKTIDIQLSLLWHSEAAKMGDLFSIIQFTNSYLWSHSFGVGCQTEHDAELFKNVLAWNETMFKHGFKDAALSIALIYEIHALKYSTPDSTRYEWWLPEAESWIKLAVQWLKIASENGSSFAAFNLGVIYDMGALGKNAIKSDVSTAITWYEKAYALGGVGGENAAYHLFWLYLNMSDQLKEQSRAAPFRRTAFEWHHKFLALSKENSVKNRNVLFQLLIGNLFCGPFSAPGSFNRHFEKHGGEFGLADSYQYYERAQEVISSGEAILLVGCKQSYVRKLNDSQYEFAIVNDHGRFVTFHIRPSEFIEQIRKDMSQLLLAPLPRQTQTMQLAQHKVPNKKQQPQPFKIATNDNRAPKAASAPLVFSTACKKTGSTSVNKKSKKSSSSIHPHIPTSIKKKNTHVLATDIIQKQPTNRRSPRINVG
jgi:TPR repeat protein